ncbi:hypothetical protein [Priestia flexa]|uniref:hypothetical protein n=1 Tax=Priestia flexa TaxID=86664 RepID=UPI001C3F4C46|nr:hypothetical protein [Priestia flexa]
MKNNTTVDITLRQFSVFLENEKPKFIDNDDLGTDGGTVASGKKGKYIVFLMKRQTDFESTNKFDFCITHLTNLDGKDLLTDELSYEQPVK